MTTIIQKVQKDMQMRKSQKTTPNIRQKPV